MSTLFSITLLASSGLLFLVQPMFAKMVLPIFGGAPSVWNVCLVFYQVALLCGYAYSHYISTRFKFSWQVILHSSLMSVAFLFLPVTLNHLWEESIGQNLNPSLHLLAILFSSIGLPFFALSANAPLLQKWFAGSNHPLAEDPYPLYRSSNWGSLLALLAYPVIIEPYSTLKIQNQLWAFLYVITAVLILICGITVHKIRKSSENSTHPIPQKDSDVLQAKEQTTAGLVPIRQQLRWIVYAFVPSSLMLSVTTYLSAEISPFPLLWVIPLSIYLVTFILTFTKFSRTSPPDSIFSHARRVRLMPIAVLPLVLLIITEATRPVWLIASFHLFSFFVIAMVCHGELAKNRPSTQNLTQFYLWLAFGGALGGLFNTLTAPLLFNSILEYPLAIVLACLIKPDSDKDSNRSRINAQDVVLPLILGIVTAAALFVLRSGGWIPDSVSLKPFLALPVIICFIFSARSYRFGFGIAAVILASMVIRNEAGAILYAERSFFGIHRIQIDPEKKYHWLIHGNTAHGGQSLDPSRASEPLAYYHPAGPLGEIFRSFNRKQMRVAVVGLGTGSMIAYGQEDQQWTFFEIDPAVVKIAESSGFFTFLKLSKVKGRPFGSPLARGMEPRASTASAPSLKNFNEGAVPSMNYLREGTDTTGKPVASSAVKYKIIFGDARLSLNRSQNQSFDLLVIDAFGSDTVPAHLLTREAVKLYLNKLSAGGLLIFHVSSRYLDLFPVLAALSKDAKLTALAQEDFSGEIDLKKGKFSSRWVIMSEQASSLERLLNDPRWFTLRDDQNATVWTDNYSNVISLLSWE